MGRTSNVRLRLGDPFAWAIIGGVLIPIIWVAYYTWNNTHNFPIFEGSVSAEIAVATAEGRLTISQLLTGDSNNAHVTLFSHLLTVLFTWTTGWNLHLEAWSNLVLGVVNYVLLLALVRRTVPQVLVYSLVPLALLHFSLRQNFNWVWGYMSQWHFVMLFVLLAMLALASPRRGIGRVLLAGMLILCASLSNTAGVAGWLAGLCYLILTPSRSWRQVGLWGGLAVVGVGLFSRLTSGAGDLSLSWYGLLKAVEFVFIAVGLVFDGFQLVPTSILVAVGAAALLLLNLGYMWWQSREAEAVAVWLSLAVFAFAAMGMAGLLRATFFEEPYRAVYMSTWYMTPIVPFWAGLIVSMIAVFVSMGDAPRPLMFVNVAFAGVMLAGYPNATQGALRAERTHELHAVSETCVRRFVFSQQNDPDCFMMDPKQHLYNALAANRLALFAKIEPELLLDTETPQQAVVLLETAHPWLNVHLPMYYLPGVLAANIHHVVPDMPKAAADVPHLPETHPPEQAEALLGSLTAQPSFWYMRRADVESTADALWEALADAGYFVVDTRARRDGLLISRVQFIPQTAANSPLFGEGVRLRAVTEIPDTIARCEPFTVRSVWQREDEIGTDYSVSLKLLNPANEQVAQQDGALTGVGSGGWLPGELYLDERSLAVPCDLPPGLYNVAMSVYFYQAPNDLLPVTGETVGEFGDLALLHQMMIR